MSSLLSNLFGALDSNVAAATPPPPGSAPVDPHTADFGKAPLAAADQLFIVEAVIVIVMCKALAWVLNKIKQPSVIAEVISGIILGPTVMGRIPGFLDTIFPAKALPIFNVIANIGLIFFMSLIGLELDFELMVSEWKRTTVISVATMVIPFAVSIGSSYAVWETFDNEFTRLNTKVKPSFGTYLLFMGVAMCVTAFPVLARIVKEKNLFRTRIGAVTLSTAAWADVAAWTLLALSISLISGGSKLNILWTFLSLIGFAVLMFGPVRWGLRKVLVKKGKSVPVTPAIFAFMIVATLICAWITAYVGLHSIFGAFIFGIILPRETGFNVKLAEKFEDFVTAFFLPLYFTASGLRTQLGLLKDFNTWGLLLLLVSVAIITKIGSGMLSARLTGLSWRESFTLGVLMNTKGLVELIVLNIGLENKLISPTTFSMMIVLALVTTFITSPIVHYSYPYYRIIEFENQTPGTTNLVLALNERKDVAPMLGLLSLISSGRPKKYRMRAVHTMALPDRPSAYMTGAHTDDILDHVNDLTQILTLRLKTVSLAYDDTEAQKVEQLATVSASCNSDFFFATWHVPVGGDEDNELYFSYDEKLGGETVSRVFAKSNFRGNLAVFVNRGLPSSNKRATFIYGGSPHDMQAAKLVKAMLHTQNAHVTVIYAMNSSIHKEKISTAAEIKDPILAALFRKARAATIELIVVHEENITSGVCNALNSIEDTGLVVCGSDIYFNSPSSHTGISLREVMLTNVCSFLVVSRGRKSASSEADSNEMGDNTLDMTRISVSTEPGGAPRKSFERRSFEAHRKSFERSKTTNGQSHSPADFPEKETPATSVPTTTHTITKVKQEDSHAESSATSSKKSSSTTDDSQV
jgi:Kef-type K+ transport system membrane component KefB